MRVAVRKLEGVESVDVSLERAVAQVQLRAGNRITLAQLRQIIKNNGFTAKDSTVTVTGHLIERGGKPALEVSNTNTVWLLTSDPQAPAPYTDAAKWLESRRPLPVDIVGVVPPPADAEQPERIIVQSIKRVPN